MVDCYVRQWSSVRHVYVYCVPSVGHSCNLRTDISTKTESLQEQNSQTTNKCRSIPNREDPYANHMDAAIVICTEVPLYINGCNTKKLDCFAKRLQSSNHGLLKVKSVTIMGAGAAVFSLIEGGAETSADTLSVVSGDLSPMSSSCSAISRTSSFISIDSGFSTIWSPDAEEMATIQEMVGPHWRERFRQPL